MTIRYLTKCPPLPNPLSLLHSNFSSSQQTIQESLQSAIQSKSYTQIPNILTSLNPNNPNPFSFLSSYTQPLKTQIIDQILQSLIPIRPRSLPHLTYSYLLSHTLENPDPFPLTFAILQRTLRSGGTPVKQTHLSLSSTWITYRKHDSVPGILSAMRAIGYKPDLNTCNYLVQSLCAVDQFDESVRVLKCMGQVGCEPNSESYGLVIGSLCGAKKTNDAVELVKEMVRVENRVVLRQGTVVKLMAAMKANGEIKKAVEMVELLEKVGVRVGFEGYEVLVEGCLEKKEFVLGGKMVIQMVEKGFIPYIRVRQRVLDGLASVGKRQFACLVRQKLADVRS
ncbi:hypothetical protein IFM89_010870 [Coptis chinensis]|uniref:Pentatricopeptide repeat-containing protein n=1 Tax=Coptis chinensis TaxID=261450 RepID=A0A835LUI7_9MAGN|nr:hypothetical protein IFM89_010870 [Coptis chinensis]